MATIHENRRNLIIAPESAGSLGGSGRKQYQQPRAAANRRAENTLEIGRRNIWNIGSNLRRRKSWRWCVEESVQWSGHRNSLKRRRKARRERRSVSWRRARKAKGSHRKYRRRRERRADSISAKKCTYPSAQPQLVAISNISNEMKYGNAEKINDS